MSKLSSFSTAEQVPLSVLNKRNREVIEAERAENETALAKAEKALRDTFTPKSPHEPQKTKSKPARGVPRKSASTKAVAAK